MPRVPWDDAKVAFGLKEVPDKWPSRPRLPKGWTLNEVDGSGAHWVVVFRVSGVPRVEDGKRVKEWLRELGAL